MTEQATNKLSKKYEFNDKYAMQMCNRLTNGFVKVLAFETENKDNDYLVKIEEIKEVSKYQVNENWIVRVQTKLEIPVHIFEYSEKWKAARLVYELELLVSGGDKVLDHIERNQKIIDESEDDSDDKASDQII